MIVFYPENLEKDANTVIVDVGGVGYAVTIPLSTFYELGSRFRSQPSHLHLFAKMLSSSLVQNDPRGDLYFKLISYRDRSKVRITMLSGMSADEIVAAIRQTTCSLIRSGCRESRGADGLELGTKSESSRRAPQRRRRRRAILKS